MDRNNYLVHYWVRIRGRLPNGAGGGDDGPDNHGCLTRGAQVIAVIFVICAVALMVVLMIGFARFALGLGS